MVWLLDLLFAFFRRIEHHSRVVLFGVDRQALVLLLLQAFVIAIYSRRNE